jgi:hypothetical protein
VKVFEDDPPIPLNFAGIAEFTREVIFPTLSIVYIPLMSYKNQEIFDRKGI